MRTLYYTKTVSRRNKEHGDFGEGDFGEIKICELTEEEAPLVFILKDFETYMKVRKFKNLYLNDSFSLPFSREEEEEWKKRQGQYTERVCKKLGIQIRKRGEDNFYPAGGGELFLIGRRLYQVWCRASRLAITHSGNITFGDWWSLDVEPKHPGKINIKFSKKRFLKELEKEKNYINAENKSRKKRIHFSYPKIKWFI